MGAGARFARSVPSVKTSSSQAMTGNGGADADLSDSQSGEPNDSFTDSGPVISLAWSGTPSDRAAASAPSEADRGSPCFVATARIQGACMDTSACAGLGGHVSIPGHCRGPANVECCTNEPPVDDHPHPPTGWSPVPQAHVTTEMTAWAAMIVESPETYPMGSTAKQLFGAIVVMARVEWHPAHLGHDVVHRGVTLYQPG